MTWRTTTLWSNQRMRNLGLSDKVKMNLRTWKRRPQVLLCANTVKPMHGVVPRLILGQRWWDETRQAAYASTNWHCIACGVHKRDAKERPFLEGHELYAVDYRKGRQTYLETVPLCHYCHSYIHDGRMQALLDKGEIDQAKFDAVIEHGDGILIAAGLHKDAYVGIIARWEDWRLVLNGVEHPPVYKTYQEWFAHFHGSEDAEDS